MQIAIGSDHAGFERKKEIIEHLQSLGHTVLDLGTFSKDSMDYPDIAVEVAEKVAQNLVERGILICGSGIGVSIVANKTEGVRAANCVNEEMARLSRQHNDANVLCLGARVTDINSIESIVDAFLETEFEGGRHEKRIKKLQKML